MDGAAGVAIHGVLTASAGFEEFFRAEHLRLRRALYLVTGSLDEAEEIAQEALVRTWERWDRVRGMRDPTGYLYRVAMNVHRSAVRRARRAALRVLATDSPRNPFAEAEDRDEAARALRTLTPRQRAALVLTELLGYGSEEAGRILEIKPVTVRVLASEGRAALRATTERDDE